MSAANWMEWKMKPPHWTTAHSDASFGEHTLEAKWIELQCARALKERDAVLDIIRKATRRKWISSINIQNEMKLGHVHACTHAHTPLSQHVGHFKHSNEMNKSAKPHKETKHSKQYNCATTNKCCNQSCKVQNWMATSSKHDIKHNQKRKAPQQSTTEINQIGTQLEECSRSNTKATSHRND